MGCSLADGRTEKDESEPQRELDNKGMQRKCHLSTFLSLSVLVLRVVFK